MAAAQTKPRDPVARSPGSKKQKTLGYNKTSADGNKQSKWEECEVWDEKTNVLILFLGGLFDCFCISAELENSLTSDPPNQGRFVTMLFWHWAIMFLFVRLAGMTLFWVPLGISITIVFLGILIILAAVIKSSQWCSD